MILISAEESHPVYYCCLEVSFDGLSFFRWLSLGNQLNGVRLVEEGLRARFKAAYPDVEVQPASPPRPSAMEVDLAAAQMRSPFAVAEPKSASAQFSETAVSGAMEVDIVS